MTQETEKAETPRIAPWIAEPYRLWSLQDLEPFRGAGFALGVKNLTMLVASLDLMADLGPERARELTDPSHRLRIYDGAIAHLDFLLGMSVVLTAQAHRVRDAIENRVPDETKTVSAMVGELINNLIFASHEPLFFFIPSASASYYSDADVAFGPDVAEAFPDDHVLPQDLAAASRCMAFREWTAAVFHLMRVVERGLQVMAESLGVTGVETMEMAVLEDALNREVSRLEQVGKTRRTQEETERMQFYSEAAIQFQNFRLAYRNYVHHARAWYDDRQALRVWGGVRDFMQMIAARKLAEREGPGGSATELSE